MTSMVETVDNTERNKMIIAHGGITYEDPILTDDYIWVELWDNGFGERGFYHLFDKDGNMKDIQVGKALYLERENNHRPKRESTANQGPKKRSAGRPRGRPKKVVSQPKKLVTKTTKTKVSKKKKAPKKVKIVKKIAAKVDTALQDRVAAFLAKKAKNNG